MEKNVIIMLTVSYFNVSCCFFFAFVNNILLFGKKGNKSGLTNQYTDIYIFRSIYKKRGKFAIAKTKLN